MFKKLIDVLAASKPSQAQVIDGFITAYVYYNENKKTKETETTKRCEIKARKEVDLEIIRNQTEIIESYLENIFSDRKIMISGMFIILDKAIESNNQELIQQSLASIVAIAKESPLAGIHNLVSDFNDQGIKKISI